MVVHNVTMVMHTCNFSTQEAATGGSSVQGHPQPHSKLKTILDYLRTCLKIRKKTQKRCSFYFQIFIYCIYFTIQQCGTSLFQNNGNNTLDPCSTVHSYQEAQLRWTSVNEDLEKLGCVYTMGHYSITKKEIPLFLPAQNNVEDTMKVRNLKITEVKESESGMGAIKSWGTVSWEMTVIYDMNMC